MARLPELPLLYHPRVLIDPEEDLVEIYLTQVFGGDFGIRAKFATMLYQSIVGD
jgi:hypothetical protein